MEVESQIMKVESRIMKVEINIIFDVMTKQLSGLIMLTV